MAHISIIKRARTAVLVVLAGGLLTAAGAQAVLGAEPGFGRLYLNGAVVGTVVPPAQVAPGSGRDPFYHVTNGTAGQIGIAGVGPGQPGYHGGDWQFFSVTFTTTPYLLKSQADVLAAEAKGDVTVVRQPQSDFRCPITSTAVG